MIPKKGSSELSNRTSYINAKCRTIVTLRLNRSNPISDAFYWEIRISDFANEHEIRKRISPPRNLSSGWISIKKSKSGFHGFPFCRSTAKSEKGFARLFSWTAVFFLLIMRARARPLFLRSVFQILFRISQEKGKNDNQKIDISAWPQR